MVDHLPGWGIESPTQPRGGEEQVTHLVRGIRVTLLAGRGRGWEGEGGEEGVGGRRGGQGADGLDAFPLCTDGQKK